MVTKQAQQAEGVILERKRSENEKIYIVSKTMNTAKSPVKEAP